MDKKVEKCDWDRNTCCVLPSWFESRDSDLALGAPEELETLWLAEAAESCGSWRTFFLGWIY